MLTSYGGKITPYGGYYTTAVRLLNNLQNCQQFINSIQPYDLRHLDDIYLNDMPAIEHQQYNYSGN